MTREEAIERLKQNKAAAEFYAQLIDNYKSVCNELKDIEAFNMAIEALSRTKQIGCTGCVHYDQQQTALICRDCKRYYRDMYEDGDKVTVMEKDKI